MATLTAESFGLLHVRARRPTLALAGVDARRCYLAAAGNGIGGQP